MESLEFTTQIGCHVNCLRHCPQEIYTKHLGHIKPLSFEQFKKLISTVPGTVEIIFAGISEPFQNSATTDMILYAHEIKHLITLFSTFSKLSIYDASRLSNIPFNKVVQHLPDACGNAHIPITQEYMLVSSYAQTHFKNLTAMRMGESFVSDEHERYFRGDKILRHTGKLWCINLVEPHYLVLPNGDVFFCCMCKGLEEKVGSLYENTYPELAAKHRPIAKRLSQDPKSICHYCKWPISSWKNHLTATKTKVFGEKPILDIIFG
jgi:hypothetical protein